MILLDTMKKHGVKRLIYSSTCATYGEPDRMPITEDTPQVILNESSSFVMLDYVPRSTVYDIFSSHD